MKIKDKALKWWADKTKKDDYVVSSSEIPDRRIREYLVKEKFLSSVTKSYWILKRSEDQIEEVFPLLYWQVVEKILSRLGQWSIWGKSALLLHNGDQKAQKHLSVKTEKKTNRKISLPLGFAISLIHDPAFDGRLVKKIDVANRKIPVDIPEKVLTDVGKLKLGNESQNFLAGTHFNLRTLEALYARNPKPIVFKRLVGIAKDVSRFDLVPGLERIIETHTHYKVGRREKIEIQATVKKQVSLTPPWVIRQEQQLEEFERTLDKQLGPKIKQLTKHPLRELLAQAKEHKKYDTYHSTTLEGYRITPEEVDALLSGIVPKERETGGPEHLENIKNRMAILGYSGAFDFIAKTIHTDFGQPKISEELVKDTYYQLFKPSADAGIIDYLSLVGYRNIAAFIRGTQYVPPSHEKLAELIASYEASVNQVRNSFVKALLAHYFFVTIHPYVDGNGRTARLLMNYCLVTEGHPWITIRADQRVEYFDALKRGQVEGDIQPFGTFIIEMIKNAG